MSDFAGVALTIAEARKIVPRVNELTAQRIAMQVTRYDAAAGLLAVNSQPLRVRSDFDAPLVDLKPPVNLMDEDRYARNLEQLVNAYERAVRLAVREAAILDDYARTGEFRR